MLNKFSQHPEAKQFVNQLVNSTGFQIWCQDYIQKRKFQLKYQILPIKPCSLQCPFSLYKPLQSQTDQLIIQIRCPQDQYKLLNLLEKAIQERQRIYQNDNKRQNGGDITPCYGNSNSFNGNFQDSSPHYKKDDLMHSSPGTLQSSQIHRARTDVGINCDAKLVSKLIINKIRKQLNQERNQDSRIIEELVDDQQLQDEKQQNQQQPFRQDSSCDVNKASISDTFKIKLQRISSDQLTSYTIKSKDSVKKKQSLFDRSQSTDQVSRSQMKRFFSGGSSDLAFKHIDFQSPNTVKRKAQSSKRFNFSLNINQLHPLSPKKGMTTKFFCEEDQPTIQEQPKISKMNHLQKLKQGSAKDQNPSDAFSQLQEAKGKENGPQIFPIQKNRQKASLIRKQSPKSIHPLNNVVKIFFGKKGFINFLNIIRRSLKGKKGDNSVSFKQDLLSELIAIKQKFKLCQTSTGTQKEQQVSQYLANTHRGQDVSFNCLDTIQESVNFPDSVSDSDVGSLVMRPTSGAQSNPKISEPNSRSQSSYMIQIQATRSKYSNELTLDRYASTKSQKSSRSVSTLPNSSILNFQYPSNKVCKKYYQFHYFCASHFERYGDQTMRKQILNCYIDGGKIKNECIPGKIIESYLQDLNKSQIQSLHGKFFKQVIKTKPLLSRIISKVKQEKSKAMLKDKIFRIRTDKMTNSRGSISTDYQNISRLGGIQNFSIDARLSRDHFGQTQQIDESLKLSIDALKQLSRQIKQYEVNTEKKRKLMNTVQTYNSKQLSKISQKYEKKYKALESFPKDDESRAMFLLNTINFTILIRIIESMKRPNGAPVTVYLWTHFLKQASLVINKRKFNILELINVFLRNESSKIYLTPSISEMLKWPKYCDILHKSQLDNELIVREKYSDISMGIHFPLKQMPAFHIFTKEHQLQNQLQKIKVQYINKHMQFEVDENAQKMIVTVPKYFEWFLLDYVGEADVVERQSMFIHGIIDLSLHKRFSELRENFLNRDMAVSVEHSPVKWKAYKRLCD